ncbi:alcohol dehydrogenase, partial [Aphelenchoides avenae]
MGSSFFLKKKVNNAAIAKPADAGFEDMAKIEIYDYVFSVNVRSVITLTRLAAPHLEKAKGSIVNISSVAAKLSGPSSYYGMSKAALDHWSADAAAEYAEKGIRVNTVSPGPIRTEFMKRHGVEGEQAQK